jgi:hypothetical protein
VESKNMDPIEVEGSILVTRDGRSEKRVDGKVGQRFYF